MPLIVPPRLLLPRSDALSYRPVAEARGKQGHTARVPQASVVIAAFNAERTVGSAVHSALSQTYPDVEVIVVDDGSTDRTAAIVEEIGDPRVRLVLKDHAGPAEARNAGAAAARGKYVAFLDSDDLLLPRYLELTTSALDAAVNPGFAYTDAYAFDGTSRRVRHRTAMQRQRPPIPPPSGRDRFLLELLARNFVYTSATVPRAVLEDVGGYRTLVRSEDYLLWLSILIRGYQPVWVPGQHALYRIGGQRSTDVIRMTRGVVQIYNWLSMDEMPTAAHRELLSRRRRWAERELRLVLRDRRPAWTIRQIRHLLGRIRQRLGLGDHWYDTPPPEVAAALTELSAFEGPPPRRDARGGIRSP